MRCRATPPSAWCWATSRFLACSSTGQGLDYRVTAARTALRYRLVSAVGRLPGAQPARLLVMGLLQGSRSLLLAAPCDIAFCMVEGDFQVPSPLLHRSWSGSRVRASCCLRCRATSPSAWWAAAFGAGVVDNPAADSVYCVSSYSAGCIRGMGATKQQFYTGAGSACSNTHDACALIRSDKQLCGRRSRVCGAFRRAGAAAAPRGCRMRSLCGRRSGCPCG